MRNRKFVKPLLIVVAMILVCIMSVFATLAYLTAGDTVGNLIDQLGILLGFYHGDDITQEDHKVCIILIGCCPDGCIRCLMDIAYGYMPDSIVSIHRIKRIFL